MSAASSHRLELKVGLLIVAGLVAVVVIILISDRFSFDRDYRVTALLRDAGGLRSGSPVTLAGLPIGKVESISTDSGDPQHPIKVVLAIKETFRLPVSSKLTVATAGILGDSYLAFSGSGSPVADDDLLPIDGTAKVIGTRGFLDTATEQGLALLGSVNDLLSADARADAKRLLRNAADLAGESAQLARQLRLEMATASKTMANLETLSRELVETNRTLSVRADRTLAAIERLAARGEQVVAGAGEAVARVDDLVLASADDLRTLAQALRQGAQRAAAVLDAVQKGEGVLGQLVVNKELARDLNQLAINLAQTSELIAEHPEALVFGQSNDQAAEYRLRRERLRLRRSFQEGFYEAPPTRAVPAPTLLESGREAAAGR